MTRATHNLRQGAAQTTTGRRCDHRHAIIGEDARLHHLHITSLPRLAERRIPASHHVPCYSPLNKEGREPCRHAPIPSRLRPTMHPSGGGLEGARGGLSGKRPEEDSRWLMEPCRNPIIPSYIELKSISNSTYIVHICSFNLKCTVALMTTQNNNLVTCSWLIISGSQKCQYLELGLRIEKMSFTLS
jgi:hypothetical protein